MMHDSSVLAVDVSNDGTLLGTTSSNGTVCIWKLSDGKMLRKLERAHGGIVGLGGGDKGEFCDNGHVMEDRLHRMDLIAFMHYTHLLFIL